MSVGLVRRDELLEEYERFSDLSVWDRTEIVIEEEIRYFIAWLHSTEGVEQMISILSRMCSSLRCFFRAASDLQMVGEGGLGKPQAWLEARICIGAGGRPGCFTLRLDPGSMQGDTVSTAIISPEGDEIGFCVFEV